MVRVGQSLRGRGPGPQCARPPGHVADLVKARSGVDHTAVLIRIFMDFVKLH